MKHHNWVENQDIGPKQWPKQWVCKECGAVTFSNYKLSMWVYLPPGVKHMTCDEYATHSVMES